MMFLFGTAPVSQYVVIGGADNKLNSMDSVLEVDIENVVIMSRAFQPIAMAFLNPANTIYFSMS